MSLLDVKPYDSWFYEEHLKDFLPETFIDCHTHIWLDEQNHFCEDNANRSCAWPNMVAHDNSVEDLNETNRLLFPENKVISVLYGQPMVTIDLKKNNAYVAQSANRYNFPALYISHPSQSAESVERAVLANPCFKGQLVSLVEKDQALETYQKVMAKKADLPEIAGLPNYPGRQYLAKVAAAAKLGEKTVVGTKDGMLAVCNGDKVFGLGPAAYNGPVRDLAATPDGKKVYGVAGHDDDLGVVFSFDEEEGLRWLGHATYAPPSEDAPPEKKPAANSNAPAGFWTDLMSASRKELKPPASGFFVAAQNSPLRGALKGDTL